MLSSHTSQRKSPSPATAQPSGVPRVASGAKGLRVRDEEDDEEPKLTENGAPANAKGLSRSSTGERGLPNAANTALSPAKSREADEPTARAEEESEEMRQTRLQMYSHSLRGELNTCVLMQIRVCDPLHRVSVQRETAH